MCRLKYMTSEIACAHRDKQPEKESELVLENSDSFERRIFDLRTLA